MKNKDFLIGFFFGLFSLFLLEFIFSSFLQCIIFSNLNLCSKLGYSAVEKFPNLLDIMEEWENDERHYEKELKQIQSSVQWYQKRLWQQIEINLKMFDRMKECQCTLNKAKLPVPPPIQVKSFVGKPGCIKIEGLGVCNGLNGRTISNSFILENLDKEIEEKLQSERLFLIDNPENLPIPPHCSSNYIHQVYCLPFLKKYGQFCSGDEYRYLEDPLINYYFENYKPKYSESKKQTSSVRLAYIILIQTVAELTINLVNTLQNPNYTFIIHPDAKMPNKEIHFLKSEFSDSKNVHILEARFNVHWGGISIVYAELAALLYLLHLDVTWDYVINLSENDFPIKLNWEIEQTLLLESGNLTKNFVSHSLLSPTSEKFNRITSYYVECYPHGLTSTNPPISQKSINETIPNYWIGTQWFVLTRNFCKYLVTSPHLKKLLSFFHTTYIPDEMFFPTMIMNSPFQETIDERDWHYVAYGRNYQKLWELDIPSFEAIQQFYVRKILSSDIQLKTIQWLQQRNNKLKK